MQSKNSNEPIYNLNIKEGIIKILKKALLILLVALSLILMFTVSFVTFYVPPPNAATEIVEKFESSITTGDINSLIKLMTANTLSDELSEFQVTTFKEYLLKNPDTFSELIKYLKKCALHYDTDNSDLSYLTKTSIAYIAKTNEDYKVVVNTSNILITLEEQNIKDASIDDIVFSIDKTKCNYEKLAKGTYRINSLIPANYNITASINNNDLSFKDSASIDTFKTFQSSKISFFDDDFKSEPLPTNAESEVLYENNR